MEKVFDIDGVDVSDWQKYDAEVLVRAHFLLSKNGGNTLVGTLTPSQRYAITQLSDEVILSINQEVFGKGGAQ